MLNIPIKQDTEDYSPHPMWLTLEKTDASSMHSHKKAKEHPLRNDYLQLDELKPGDVFVSGDFNDGFVNWEIKCMTRCNHRYYF